MGTEPIIVNGEPLPPFSLDGRRWLADDGHLTNAGWREVRRRELIARGASPAEAARVPDLKTIQLKGTDPFGRPGIAIVPDDATCAQDRRARILRPRADWPTDRQSAWMEGVAAAVQAVESMLIDA